MPRTIFLHKEHSPVLSLRSLLYVLSRTIFRRIFIHKRAQRSHRSSQSQAPTLQFFLYVLALFRGQSSGGFIHKRAQRSHRNSRIQGRTLVLSLRSLRSFADNLPEDIYPQRAQRSHRSSQSHAPIPSPVLSLRSFADHFPEVIYPQKNTKITRKQPVPGGQLRINFWISNWYEPKFTRSACSIWDAFR
jgi:hypothetical protein